MEESVKEVLLRERLLASGTYPPNYPPSLPESNEVGARSLLSLLLPRGIIRFKERWSEYRKPKKLRRYAFMFVSPTAEYVAVAVGSQITIFHKGNNYQEPTGTFISGCLGTFVIGTWSETHDVLGVVDDSDTIYFVRSNGEVISRIPLSNLRVSLPLLGLILHDASPVNQSCLCTFSILASNGLLHNIELSQDPSASAFSAGASNNGALLKQHFPRNVLCLDYNPRLMLFAIVGSSGNFLSVWQRTSSSDLELVVSTELECMYSECDKNPRVSPKVLISPEGKYIATLDERGHMYIFKFHNEQQSLLKIYSGRGFSQKMETDFSSRGMEPMNDVLDFTWWSDVILAFVGRKGSLTLFDICTGDKLSEGDSMYSTPLLERVDEVPGILFLLECTPSDVEGASNLYLIEQFRYINLLWNLVSVSETSVTEMFHSLIHNQQYQNAIIFADQHGLDKDVVLKSQWLASKQGVDEINTLLSTIKDPNFVISESVKCVGPTEEAVKVLIGYGLSLTDFYRFSEPQDDADSQIWDFRMARLKLLQHRDRLETYVGINMGRFSVLEYKRFRDLPLNEAAMVLAESGKIGALNLLFKRHPHALAPFMLEILAAIPETIPVQTYAQLLPGSAAPTNIILRDEDWVECDTMVSFIRSLPENQSSNILFSTEPIVKRYRGSQWPSTKDLSVWYKSRARDIDTLTGLLDNSMCLIDLACRKGIIELQDFLEDISYLHQLIYADDITSKTDVYLRLCSWEVLPDYEKFKMMLVGVEDKSVVETLQKKAIPFMQKRSSCMPLESRAGTRYGTSDMDVMTDSFLVRWLKEMSAEHKLETCLIIIEGSKVMENTSLFRDEVELVECSLQCIYLCSAMDRWATMASILSRLPQLRGLEHEGLRTRLKLAEGHVEAGRLLAVYQVPKPISYFLEAHTDEKGVKQILRLILSKFVRRQQGRSDNDWTNMWHDLLSLQEKAFPFLDLEYLLLEFCRGLLKAGKFSLARNYLKGSGSVRLAADKAETLVIQSAREYFFSASSLDCQEVWKAKECLDILPSSRNARAEADIIDAVTLKLPNLGVNILPLQFRQMKDPMEVVKLAIRSQAGAYLNVDGLIEVAKLLGLSSQDDISSVQEAIAREAAVAGDLQLSFDLCLVLAKKGHGSVWDLCTALARGPALENMDVISRKNLLGFALSHCDEESIGELLQSWKDLDMLEQCQTLKLREGEQLRSSIHDPSTITYSLYDPQDMVDRSSSGNIGSFEVEDTQFHIRSMLSQVARNMASESDYLWDSILENGKIMSFAAQHLPWLLRVCNEAETNYKNHVSGSILLKRYASIRTQVILTIISWLARNGFAPKDDLIISLAKSIMASPVTEEEDIIGCSFLLNLADAFQGVDVIEGLVQMRENYSEISSAMNVGVTYGLLHNRGSECMGPTQRRVLLLREFQQRQQSVVSDEIDEFDMAQSTFWKEWNLKLEEQRRVAEESRILEQIIPGIETTRFFSGDMDYIESVVFSLIESVKEGKIQILKDVLRLAEMYGLDNTKVLLRYMSCILVSGFWTVDDIAADLSEFKEVLFASAVDAIKIISVTVYPVVDGRDKERLACIYGLLSQCYFSLQEPEEPFVYKDPSPANAAKLAHFCRIVGQECLGVSSIHGLNFKNIAGLQHLNWDSFNNEVSSYIDESNVDTLANMVRNLVGLYGDSVPQGILQWQDVYRSFVLNKLTTLEARSKIEVNFLSSENVHSFVCQLEQTYDVLRKFMKFIDNPVLLDLVKRFFTMILPTENTLSISSDQMWKESLIMLLNVWIKIMNDIEDLKIFDECGEGFCSERLVSSLEVFVSLITEGKVSPYEGWGTVVAFVNFDLLGSVGDEVFNFCKAMLFSGCRFSAIMDVFTCASHNSPLGSARISHAARIAVSIQDLPNLYLRILETTWRDLAGGFVGQNLQHLVSSLCKLEGDLETLDRVRQAVWSRLAEVSEDLEFSSQIRVYVLELMQCIAATDKSAKLFSSELQASVNPWEGWQNVQRETLHRKISDDGTMNISDTSNRFTSTLVALKSSQLLSDISPKMEITPEDLLTIESAVLCFHKACEGAASASHIDALVAMLQEWDFLFVTGNVDSLKVSDCGNRWNNDDWDEGWESFGEEPVEKETNSSSNLSVHPLHACWLEIFKKLMVLSEHRTLLKLIGKHSSVTKKILLDEDDARCLNLIMLEIDCFLALKIMLLFPFEELKLQCLDAIEDRLKQGVSKELGKDYEMLILVLSSGIVRDIVTKSSYGTTFSYLCYMVGNISRVFQEAQLVRLKDSTTNEDERSQNFNRVFADLLFPCFVAELVQADQKILAGFLVTKFVHTNPSLSLLNVAEDSLRMYFLKKVETLEEDESIWEGTDFEEHLVNCISSMRGRFGNLMQLTLDLCS